MVNQPVPGWETTRLWKELERREGDVPAEKLARVLPPILLEVETILRSGDSGPGSFTLHDDGHSRRVAERIPDLAGPELLEQMGAYDIGLLLLSAYLHDIGMTPPVANLVARETYLLTGDADTMSEDDRLDLQAWLDDEAYGISPPLSESQPTAAILQQARSLVARYTRARHNERSEGWMREHLAKLDGDTYEGCLSDLVALCVSHHFGIEKLRSDRFEPRYVGAPASVLHLRFDACLLRVADVLDFDPERTPRILYMHRNVEESSAIFWHKDHMLSFVQADRVLSIHARPPNAVIHHAVEVTADDVDRELQLARQLGDEIPFDRMGDTELPHLWRMDINVRRNIKPRDNAYEYMDGTFRPDQERILKLLGGEALYGSPLAAVREVVQNAFDAVREQIAYERLADDIPGSEETLERIAAIHSIGLTLEHSDEGVRLICRDSGVGMSRELIRSRFLVGGSTPSHEMRTLERACEDEGFKVGRTSRFGIGVLAYFLLGSRLRLTTRRSTEGQDTDGVGWTFTSDGLTDFGELKRNPNCSTGTQIELLVRLDVMPDGVQKFIGDLDAYLRRTIRRAPCRFTFRIPGSNLEPLEGGPGWFDRTTEAEGIFLARVTSKLKSSVDTDLTIFSSQRRRIEEQRHRRFEEVERGMRAALSVNEEIGDLPDGLGSFRIYTGHFELRDEVLLAYFDLVDTSDGKLAARPIEGNLGISMGSSSRTSWNGIAITNESAGAYGLMRRRLEHGGLFYEIDWTSDDAGELAVNRGTLKPSLAADQAVRFVERQARAIQRQLARANPDSPFALINAGATNVAIPVEGNPLWPQSLEETTASEPKPLTPLTMPVVDGSEFAAQEPPCAGEGTLLAGPYRCRCLATAAQNISLGTRGCSHRKRWLPQ